MAKRDKPTDRRKEGWMDAGAGMPKPSVVQEYAKNDSSDQIAFLKKVKAKKGRKK